MSRIALSGLAAVAALASVAAVVAAVATAATVAAPPVAASADEAPVVERVPIRYQAIARDARLNRRVLGEPTSVVRGVVAEPVDSMVYDGTGHTPIEGVAILEMDPVSLRGLVRARWTDANGRWELRQSFFHHPEHLSGVRMGASRGSVRELINLGAAQNVYVHGDTGVGPPGVPTVFAYLATWGLFEVTLDGEPFENPFGWPGPELWLGHAMISEGVRQPDGTVRAEGGEIYNPMKHAASGVTDPADLELHIAFHDERFPATRNVPAMFAFEYHLVFEDVLVRIVESQQPLSFDDAAELSRPGGGSDTISRPDK